jgi:hypothetical protein
VTFHTDSIHLSRLPRHISNVEQQVSLFAEQLAPHSPAAAAACCAVLELQPEGGTWAPAAAANSSSSSSISWLGAPAGRHSTHHQQQQQQEEEEGAAGLYGVWLSACCTYRLPDASKRFTLQHILAEDNSSSSSHQQYRGGHTSVPAAALRPHSHSHTHQHQQQQQQQLVVPPSGSYDDDESEFLDWDAESAWYPWAVQRNPVAVLELDLVWQDTRLAAAGSTGSTTHTAAAAAASPGGFLQGSPPSSSAAAAGGLHRSALSPGAMGSVLSDASAADVWVLHVLTRGYSSAPTRSGRLGVKGYERHRRHVRLEGAGEGVEGGCVCGGGAGKASLQQTV